MASVAELDVPGRNVNETLYQRVTHLLGRLQLEVGIRNGCDFELALAIVMATELKAKVKLSLGIGDVADTDVALKMQKLRCK